MCRGRRFARRCAVLSSTGLIDLIPNRGAFTAILSEDRLREMFIAMAEMEATCARLAAISMTQPERQGLPAAAQSHG